MKIMQTKREEIKVACHQRKGKKVTNEMRILSG